METILFLEGSKVFNHENYVYDEMDTPRDMFNTIVLDNLYVEYRKLATLNFINADYIHIRTTGIMVEKLNILINLFESLDYIPKNVIFYSERSVMALLGLARDLKSKGTEFYYLEDGELVKIDWI